MPIRNQSAVGDTSPNGRRRPRLALAAALLLCAAPAAAHDFWIAPSAFAPAVGAAVDLRLQVGEHFAGEPVPRDPSRIVRFEAVGPAGARAIAGNPGDEPAGALSPAAPGLWIVAYRSNHAYLELEPAKFEEYLRLEGLESQLAERARRREQAAKSRELYSRNAKTLLRAGGTGGTDRALGLQLELIAERDPSTLGRGELLPVKLLFEGRPLAGALVTAVPQSDPARAQSARTDREGRVRFALDARGPWLIKTVHMARWQRDDRAEWESFWSSLTFAAPERAEASR